MSTTGKQRRPDGRGQSGREVKLHETSTLGSVPKQDRLCRIVIAGCPTIAPAASEPGKIEGEIASFNRRCAEVLAWAGRRPA